MGSRQEWCTRRWLLLSNGKCLVFTHLLISSRAAIKNHKHNFHVIKSLLMYTILNFREGNACMFTRILKQLSGGGDQAAGTLLLRRRSLWCKWKEELCMNKDDVTHNITTWQCCRYLAFEVFSKKQFGHMIRSKQSDLKTTKTESYTKIHKSKYHKFNISIQRYHQNKIFAWINRKHLQASHILTSRLHSTHT